MNKYNTANIDKLISDNIDDLLLKKYYSLQNIKLDKVKYPYNILLNNDLVLTHKTINLKYIKNSKILKPINNSKENKKDNENKKYKKNIKGGYENDITVFLL
jgi:hypothetical protein